MSDFNVIGNVHIIVLPWYEFGPTAVTTYLPTPSRILLPLTMKGSNLLLNLAPWTVLSRAYSAGELFSQHRIRRCSGFVGFDIMSFRKDTVDWNEVARFEMQYVSDHYIVYVE